MNYDSYRVIALDNIIIIKKAVKDCNRIPIQIPIQPITVH